MRDAVLEIDLDKVPCLELDNYAYVALSRVRDFEGIKWLPEVPNWEEIKRIMRTDQQTLLFFARYFGKDFGAHSRLEEC